MPIPYLVTHHKSYKPLKPIFSAVYNHFNAQQTQQQGVVPIRIADVVEVSSMMEGRYEATILSPMTKGMFITLALISLTKWLTWSPGYS